MPQPRLGWQRHDRRLGPPGGPRQRPGPRVPARKDLGASLRTLLLAPLFLLLASWPLLAPTDPDYWWHARTGQLIVETGSVPRADPYSFTAAGQPWIAHEWLTELIFFVVQRQVGYVGGALLIGLLGTLGALALYATCRLWGLGELAAVVLVLWAFGMSLGSFGVRPQTFTRVLLALTALVLTTYRQGGPTRILWLLPPLFGLWSNLHGGFILGLGLLALTLAGDTFDALRARSIGRLMPLLIVTALSTLATLLNPNGVAGLVYPLAYAAQPEFQAVVAEWQTPDFRRVEFAQFGLSMLLALGLGFGRGPLKTAEILWGCCFGLLGLQSVRNIQLWATVAMPLIGARLRRELPALGRSITEWQRPVRMGALWSVVTVLSAGLWGWRLADTGNWQLQLAQQPSTVGYPTDGMAYLREHNLRGNLFNQFEWGGYLIYTLYPGQRVFIDGRVDLYGDALLRDYLAIERVQPGWRALLDRYAVRLALVERGGPLSAALAREPNWRELSAGVVERLFERAGP